MKQVTTKILIEELQTDGHSPMKFICSDGAVYFVKYRSGKSFNKNEIHCLVFEMLCTALLKGLHIPVPDDALVIIDENSFAPGQLVTNKRYARHGVIAWGSKEIVHADLVKEIEQIKHKKEFNKLENPADLIRIAIFDVWIDNADRHSGNYNLLLKMEDSRLKIITIDHAFTFGGLKGMNIFNPTTLPAVNKKLIESQYFQSAIKYFNNEQRIDIATQFLSLIPQLNIENIVHEVFAEIPAQWEINPTLEKRIIDFLTSEQRYPTLNHICKKALQKNFRRKNK
ncbi:MAG: hypothetical protein LH615_10980 [Ferruginibacter sp.]|nr:hypothetical protein [Ferruginibacter sp.]